MTKNLKAKLHELDLAIGNVLPTWLIELAVSIFFAAVCAAVVGLIAALIFLDWSMLWSTTPRAVFGVLTAIFMLMLWSDR